MERAPETCIVCGTQKRKLLIEKDSWKIYRCEKCGLGFLDPRPSQEEIECLYRREYFSQRYDEGLDSTSLDFQKRLSSEKHRIHFIEKVKQGGRLLDVGCGYGYFLAACRNEGYEVHGLGVSKWATQYASEKLGIPIRVGKIADVAFPAHHFDIITMWHTLEHTLNPRQELEKVKNWLREDGILVAEIPNYEGTDAQRMWHQWDNWCLPYHLWHFSPQTLE